MPSLASQPQPAPTPAPDDLAALRAQFDELKRQLPKIVREVVEDNDMPDRFALSVTARRDGTTEIRPNPQQDGHGFSEVRSMTVRLAAGDIPRVTVEVLPDEVMTRLSRFALTVVGQGGKRVSRIIFEDGSEVSLLPSHVVETE